MNRKKLDIAVSQKRSDWSASRQALEALEDALEDPIPGREADWIKSVAQALDILIDALDVQAAHNRSPVSLLSQIALEEPRFEWQIGRLEDELDELRRAEQSLRDEIVSQQNGPDTDLATIRTRLGELDTQYRFHRARETDLVYEAITVDIGGKG